MLGGLYKLGDLLLALLIFLGSIFVATVSRLLSEEIRDNSVAISEFLTALAVRLLPSSLRDQMQREWQNNIENTPGKFFKVCVAIGFVLKSLTFRSHEKKRAVTLFAAEAVAHIHDRRYTIANVMTTAFIVMCVWARPIPNVQSHTVLSSILSDYNEIVIDSGSGKILNSASVDVTREPADLEKLMTIYLAFNSLDRKKR
jgi:hypothetical protein